MLPGTPTHQPQHDYRRTLGRGALIISGAEYLPFAESADLSLLVCLDRRGLTGQGGAPQDDSPVVAFRAEEVFRLTPRLLAEHARGRMGVGDQRGLVEPLARPLFGSLREMLTALCLPECFAWSDAEVCPYARTPQNIPPAQDWGPWLTPEPALDREGPSRPDDAALPDLPDHCARIAGKVELLRLLDPAFLTPGSEAHLHRMNPVLLPA
ncbi:MAG TPA: hypothetical protein VIL46_10040 [Gemmataceae bacterium]